MRDWLIDVIETIDVAAVTDMHRHGTEAIVAWYLPQILFTKIKTDGILFPSVAA